MRPADFLRGSSSLALTAVALGLAACAHAPEPEAAPHSTTTTAASKSVTTSVPPSEQPTSMPHSTVAASNRPVPSVTPTQAPHGTTTEAGQPSCDPRSSDPLNRLITPTPLLPYSDGTTAYFFGEPSRRFYAPCAPLSWDFLGGTISIEKDRPGATIGSFYETVIFFSYGKIVKQTPPPLAARVYNAKLISPTTVEVTYGIDTDNPRVMDKFKTVTNEYQLKNGELVLVKDGFVNPPDPADQTVKLNLAVIQLSK